MDAGGKRARDTVGASERRVRPRHGSVRVHTDEGATRLDTLPPEMVDHIGSFLGTRDLRSLAGTSSRARAVVEERLGEGCVARAYLEPDRRADLEAAHGKEGVHGKRLLVAYLRGVRDYRAAGRPVDGRTATTTLEGADYTLTIHDFDGERVARLDDEAQPVSGRVVGSGHDDVAPNALVRDLAAPSREVAMQTFWNCDLMGAPPRRYFSPFLPMMLVGGCGVMPCDALDVHAGDFRAALARLHITGTTGVDTAFEGLADDDLLGLCRVALFALGRTTALQHETRPADVVVRVARAREPVRCMGGGGAWQTWVPALETLPARLDDEHLNYLWRFRDGMLEALFGAAVQDGDEPGAHAVYPRTVQFLHDAA